MAFAYDLCVAIKVHKDAEKFKRLALIYQYISNDKLNLNKCICMAPNNIFYIGEMTKLNKDQDKKYLGILSQLKAYNRACYCNYSF